MAVHNVQELLCLAAIRAFFDNENFANLVNDKKAAEPSGASLIHSGRSSCSAGKTGLSAMVGNGWAVATPTRKTRPHKIGIVSSKIVFMGAEETAIAAESKALSGAEARICGIVARR
jgi:hypothetical protein